MTHDPMLAAATQYRIDLARYNADPSLITVDGEEAARATTWGPFYEAETLPEITTPAGAIMALRVSIEEIEQDLGDHFAERMAKAALAFFERLHGDGGAS